MCGCCLDTPACLLVRDRLSSASVSPGYWQLPGATRETFGAQLVGAPGQSGSSGSGAAAGFLRTGDLGYVVGGRQFVSGRIKDTIIIGGRNYYAAGVCGLAYLSVWFAARLCMCGCWQASLAVLNSGGGGVHTI